jgi:hypothetical protein
VTKTLKLTAPILALIVLVGCGSGVRKGAVSDSPAPDSATVAPSDTTEDDVTSDEINAKFGQSATMPGSNVLISTTKLVIVKPSEWSAPQVKKGGKARAFGTTVTIANRGATSYDTTLMSYEALCGSEQPEQLFDSANGYNGQPSKKLSRNTTVKFKIAFVCVAGQLNPIELDVENVADFTTDAEVTFKGALK